MADLPSADPGLPSNPALSANPGLSANQRRK
jgi:hypothetical protein